MDAKSFLLKKPKLRTALLQMSDKEFQKFQQNLDESLAVRNQRIEEEKQRKIEQENKIQRIRELCEEEGIDVDALLAKDTAKTTSSAQYKMTDSQGNEVTWSGKGRLPKAFKQAKEQGIDLEQFKI